MVRTLRVLAAVAALLPLAASAEEVPAGAAAPPAAVAPPAEAVPAAAAPGGERAELVEEILVKGRRQPRVDALEVREVRESPAHDLGEALSQHGIASAVRKGGIASDVVIRGFQRDNVVVSIDGARIHGACPNRMDPPAFHVDYAEVDRVELRRGPFDVASPGGLGGTVEVRTRNPGPGVSGELNVGYGETQAFEASGTAAWGGERLGVLGGAAFKEALPFESGDGLDFTEIYPASSPNRYRGDVAGQEAYEVKSGWAKGTWAPADGHRAELSYALQHGDHVLYPYLKMDARYDDTHRANAAYETGALGPFSRARAQAFFTHVLHDMDDAHRCSSWATVGDCGTVLPQGWSMRTGAESWVVGGAVEAVVASAGETTAGVDFSLRSWNADTTRYRRGGTPGYFAEDSIPDVTTMDLGLRAQHEVALGARVRLRAGARLDLARADPAADRSAEYAKYYAGLPGDLARDDVLLSGNVQVDVKVTDDVTAFAGYGHGARLPDAQERYFALSPMSATSQGTVGLPTLDPVRNDELDLGAKLAKGPLLVRVQVFASWLADYVAVVEVAQLASPTLLAKSWANVEAFMWGGEASVRVALPWDLYASGTLAYAQGRNETADAWLAEVPPLRGTAALRWDDRRWFVEAETAIADDQRRVDATVHEQPTGGWAILNLKAGGQLGGAKVFAGVRNVFDRMYHEHLSFLRDPFASGVRVPEPGRVAYLTAQYAF
ncbi:MAG TPA: TonB-dependent receptor [Anaeromyxobacter sp.]|nr:TonB-dependent receptor [Anaeromyxobacter sp.]